MKRFAAFSLLLATWTTLAEPTQDLRGLVANSSKPVAARIAALWALNNVGQLDEPTLTAALNAPEPALVRNALSALARSDRAPTFGAVRSAIVRHLNHADGHVRLQAVLALGAVGPEKEGYEALVRLFPNANDAWTESAIVSVASQQPVPCLHVALTAEQPDSYRALVSQLAAQVAARPQPDEAGQLLIVSAGLQPSADALKVTIYETLAKTQKPEMTPPWGPELKQAFQTILASANASVPVAALPLLARWDKEGTLRAEAQGVVQQLATRLDSNQETDEARAQLAASLLGARQLSPEVLATVGKLVGSAASPALQRRVIEALGATGDPAVGSLLTAAYPNLPSGLQEIAFAQLIKRADWAGSLVDSVKAGQVTLLALGPANIHRLRTHSDATVARRASAAIDDIRGPQVKEKEALIAQIEPVANRPGNLENGGKLYVQNCGVCHKLNGQGAEVGPDLTGMGVHGTHELLVHIIDPNRFVEENFIAVSLETKDDQVFDGIVVRENRAVVTLRNNAGEIEIKTADIKSRRNTGRSLMPEGFEALGAEGVRDILAYMGTGESRFKVLDLKPAFTVTSMRGIYSNVEATDETLRFRKFGLVTVEGVPFEIVNPAKTISGNNLVGLKGGTGYAQTLPQKVELPVGLKANKLHFLGGVGGWAWPCCGPDANKGLPVAKITVHFADGQTEEHVLTNGVHVVDYINASYEVPGSSPAPGLVSRGQVRWLTRPVKNKTVVEKITLESFDNSVAPTFVAITAETGSPGATDAPPPAAASGGSASSATSIQFTPKAPGVAGVRGLMLGGGSSHDFERWFHRADKAILQELKPASLEYTEDVSRILPALPNIDLLYVSLNNPIPDPATRRAIFAYADAGRSFLIVHAGLWYNWRDWPEYNSVLCGGGSRGHDRLGEFEVKLSEEKHPVTADVPAMFKITDECYWFEPATNGTPIQVLATAYSAQKDRNYPSVWIVKHPKARIVGMALGHDGRAHDHPAYQKLLQNSLRWLAGE